MLNRVLRVLCLVLFLAGSSRLAPAQVVTGSIIGTITDSSGSVIPGVKAGLLAPATGLSRSASTNESGVCAFNALPADAYTLTIEHGGFR